MGRDFATMLQSNTALVSEGVTWDPLGRLVLACSTLLAQSLLPVDIEHPCPFTYRPVPSSESVPNVALIWDLLQESESFLGRYQLRGPDKLSPA